MLSITSNQDLNGIKAEGKPTFIRFPQDSAISVFSGYSTS